MSVFLVVAAFVGGAFAAWVIGANSASPSFGPVTSAGAAHIFRGSLIVGLAAFLGAVIQGGAVTDTVGNQMVQGMQFDILHAAIILLTASILILGSVLMKYPMPTAFTLVGSALGVGVAAGGTPNIPQLKFIGLVWLIIPFVGITIGYVAARFIRGFFDKNERNKKYMRQAVLGLGAYTAFTAGANQSGLIIGPLINAVNVDMIYLLVFAGAGMVVGAWTGSPRIIESVSNEYSLMGPRRAISALLAASLIAQVATLYGVPVSFNEAVISAVIGAGLVEGRSGIGRRKILKTVMAWIGALLVSFGAAFIVMQVITVVG